jgi:hypothetical protein
MAREVLLLLGMVAASSVLHASAHSVGENLFSSDVLKGRQQSEAFQGHLSLLPLSLRERKGDGSLAARSGCHGKLRDADAKDFDMPEGSRCDFAFVHPQAFVDVGTSLLGATALRVKMLLNKEGQTPLDHHPPTPSPTSLDTLGEVATLRRIPAKRCPMCGTPCSVKTTDNHHIASQCDSCHWHS